MPVPVGEIIKQYKDDPAKVQRIAYGTAKRSIALIEYDSDWPKHFQIYRKEIADTLDPLVTTISHVGSTSVPGLPAKDIIDIDLTVPDISDEDAYVPLLKSLGWTFNLREPTWYQHRYFTRNEPFGANLHVWGPDCAEAERHRIFRDWLIEHPADKDLYLQGKLGAVADTAKSKGTMVDYTRWKDDTIRTIMEKAYRSLGYLQENERALWDQEQPEDEK